MGMWLWSVALVWFLIAGSIQSQQTTDAFTLSADAEADALARQMLMIASAAGLYRHTSGQDALPPLSDLPGVGFSPDARIRWHLQSGRFWIWIPEQPGLMAALQARSRHSQLLGYSRQHRFILADGSDSGLQIPSAIPDNAVIYLN